MEMLPRSGPEPVRFQAIAEESRMLSTRVTSDGFK